MGGSGRKEWEEVGGMRGGSGRNEREEWSGKEWEE